MQITSARAMKRIGYGCLCVIAVWLVFVIWLYTGFSRGQQELSSSSLVEYQKSDTASWIALPDNAREITTYRHLGFDTNYRYLKATLSEPIPALPDLIAQSISLQPFKPNETYVLVENVKITYEEFVLLFTHPVPTWWEVNFSRFDQQAFCVWETTNGYGYGYIYLYDSAEKELFIFQWSQQHKTVQDVRDSLE